MWKLVRYAAASNLARSRRFSAAIPGPCIVHKRGADILHDPWFNKVSLITKLFNFAFCFLLVFYLILAETTQLLTLYLLVLESQNFVDD